MKSNEGQAWSWIIGLLFLCNLLFGINASSRDLPTSSDDPWHGPPVLEGRSGSSDAMPVLKLRVSWSAPVINPPATRFHLELLSHCTGDTLRYLDLVPGQELEVTEDGELTYDIAEGMSYGCMYQVRVRAEDRDHWLTPWSPLSEHQDFVLDIEF